jgi:hypothetical protein
MCGDVKMSEDNVQEHILQGRNIRGRNVSARILPVPVGGGKKSDTGIIPMIFTRRCIILWITLMLLQPPLSHTSR